MIRDMSFGALFKAVRIKNKETLRAYCRRTGFDSGNISKLERNLISPPKDTGQLMSYLEGLEYTEDEFDYLKTAAVNHYLSKVIAKF